MTNKCRCEYVFCDTHRYPDKHDCNFDHAQNDKGKFNLTVDYIRYFNNISCRYLVEKQPETSW